jgi:hypothetical protein
VTKLRRAEKGWEASVAAAAALKTVEAAEAAGKAAWKQQRLWAAELFWSRAIELSDVAKDRTNRAHARVVHGARVSTMDSAV